MAIKAISQSSQLTSIPPSEQDTPILKLSIDIFQHMVAAGDLEGVDLHALMLTCKPLNEKLESAERVWQSLFSRDNPDSTRPPQLSFRQAYQRAHWNLLHGIYAMRHFPFRSDSGIYEFFVLDGKQMVATVEGSIIHLQNFNDYSQPATQLRGHTGTVFALAVHEGELFSRADDNTIRIWDLKSGNCIMIELDASGSGVDNHLLVREGKLIFNNDVEIIVCDLEKLIRIPDSFWGMDQILVEDGRLYCRTSGSFPKLHIWDLEKVIPLVRPIELDDGVTSFAIKDNMLITFSNFRGLRIFDMKTDECIGEFRDFAKKEKDFRFQPNLAFSNLAIIGDKLVSYTEYLRRITIRDLNTCHPSPEFYHAKNFSIFRGMIMYDGFTDLESIALDSIHGHSPFKSSCIFRDLDGVFLGSIPTHSPLRTFSRRLGLMTEHEELTILDFGASLVDVFSELAGELRQNRESLGFTIKRFQNMPKKARDAIYGKLYEICKPFTNDYMGCGEDAFHDRNGQSSTREQKAQAIEAYLSTLI